MAQELQGVREELKKVIIGKEEITDKVLMAILAGGHILLEDVPGVGKTTTALAFSAALGLSFHRIQFTPDVVPSDVTGFTVYDKNSGEFRYSEGAVMCNLLLADEINRTSSKTQSALLEVMEEGHVTVDGTTHDVPHPFVVIATQNPVGTAGTQMLPESQLDRFMVKLSMGYPDKESQNELLRDRQTENPLDKVGPVLDTEKLMKIRSEVQKVEIADSMISYITELTDATRHNDIVRLGVSPRGALALSRMTKACAYLSGRDFCIPEDVQKVFFDVCGHRIVLSPKAKMSEETEETVLTRIMKETSAPEIK